MRWDYTGLSLLLSGLLATACATPRAGDASRPISVYGATSTLELTPVTLAARIAKSIAIDIQPGGVVSLFTPASRADVATNAETQALRVSVAHPDLRIILPIAEGHYSVVARRSAGIATVADLRGKRVATLTLTSSGYYLSRLLQTAELTLDDVDIRQIQPLSEIVSAIVRREVDAVAIWEPHGENAFHALGADAVRLQYPDPYRERFNLHARASDLADPAKRRRIVALVRAIVAAGVSVRREPDTAMALAVESTGHTSAEVAQAWPMIGFAPAFPDNLLDVLVREEAWLAAIEHRSTRDRATLATLIDRSVYDEAVTPGQLVGQ